jgi:hypothetical protein
LADAAICPFGEKSGGACCDAVFANLDEHAKRGPATKLRELA